MGKRKEVVLINFQSGVYSVSDSTWVVGRRYKLHERVGAGSYGVVCRATDLDTHEMVALKRIPDVFSFPELAKRIIREISIMRRLRHPNIIALSNIFTSYNLDSTTKGGVDVYIATEFADGGDMYHMKSPLLEDEVRLLLWQLLSGVRYMHSCDVWHRDIKSENVLFSSVAGAKICDFGLSRSAAKPSADMEPNCLPATGSRNSRGKPMLTRQYSKTVVTANYRAPEVVMSHGQYTSAIDIWALGCVFWELLDRQFNSTRSRSQPRTLFEVREEFMDTPAKGESYAKFGNSKLAEQLDVIFDVIGTPCWKDIECVPSESWRSYLVQVPGRAGNLIANLRGVVDEEALDLLSRMLSFDPARRCTAEEALAHTYFKGLNHHHDLPPVSFADGPSPLSECPVAWLIGNTALTLGLLEEDLENSLSQRDGGRETLKSLLQMEVDKQQECLRINSIVRSSICELAKH